MAGAAGLALGGRALPVLGLAEPALAPAEVVGLAGATLTSSSLLPKTGSLYTCTVFIVILLLSSYQNRAPGARHFQLSSVLTAKSRW